MFKISYQAIAIAIVAIIGLFVFRSLSPEDTWICQKGKWVKHGNPSVPKPASMCK